MKSSDHSIHVQVRPIFPTFVAEIDHPDPVPLNKRLLQFIRKIRSEAQAEERITTIKHGWRSRSDLLKHNVPEIRTLREFFDQSIHAYVKYWTNQAGAKLVADRLGHRYKGWAVVLSKNGYQHQHVHSRTDLVGVYCVEQSRAKNMSNAGGALTLVDPRTGRLSTRPSWESDVVSLLPVPGRLFLIPSFVAHRIEAVTGDGERVTINFDVILAERSR